MKKSLIALVVAGSLVLAGCSSSGGVAGDSQSPTIPDIDNSPEWGLDTGNLPSRPEPVDPGFGVAVPSQPPVDNAPDRPTPDMGDTPDWGLDMGNAPDRPEPTDPDFGVAVPTQPPVDNAPDRPTPDMGDTPEWGLDSPVDRPEPVDPSFGVDTNPEVSPAINSIDRNKVRDALRSRLNG